MTAKTASPASLEPVISALAARIKLGRAILCIGNNWGNGDVTGVLEKLAQKLADPERTEIANYINKRPFWAAGYLRRKLDEKFVPSLRDVEQFHGDATQLEKLAALPWRAVLTTAIGDAVAQIFSATTDGGVFTSSDSTALQKELKKSFFLKTRGDINRPETLIWGAEDVERLVADANFNAIARQLFQTRSIFFVGFAPADAEFALLTERLFGAAFDSRNEHYALFDGVSPLEQAELLAAYGIRSIAADDLATFTLTLAGAVDAAQGSSRPDEDDLAGWLEFGAAEDGRTEALEALTRMESRFTDTAAHEKLVDLYIGRVDFETDHLVRAELLGKVAHLFETKLSDPQRALTVLMAAYREAPGTEIWSELERLAQATGQWSDLVALAAEGVEELPREHQLKTWLALARISSQKLGNTDYALFAADKVLAIDSAQPEARQLKRLELRRSQKWAPLMAFIEEEAEATSDAALRTKLYTELSELYETHEGNSPKVIEFAEKALSSDEASEAAKNRVENLLRAQGKWKNLLALLEKRVVATPGDERVAMQREIATIYADRLHDPRTAIEKYEILRTLAPDDLSVLRILARLYREDGRYEQQLAIMAEEAERVESERGRADLWRQIASEWELHPDGAAKAAHAWEKYLEVSPRAEEAFGALERIYWNEKDWGKLASVYERHAEVTSGPARADLLCRAGDIYDRELNYQAKALGVFERATEAQAQNSFALTALARLSAAAGQLDQAAAYFERQVTLEESSEQKVKLLYEWGRLLGGKLGDSAKAETVFARLLEIDPRHTQATTAMVELYRERGEFLRAARLLEEAVPHVQNRLDRTRFLVEAAEIYEGLDEKKRAVALYQQTLEADPEHVEAAERLSDLLWKEERYQDLLPLLEMVTRRTQGREGGNLVASQQIKWLVRLGQAAQKLGQPAKAVAAFEGALKLDANHVEAQKGLGEAQFAMGDWDKAVEVLSNLANDTTATGADRTELYYHLGVAELRRGRRKESGSWLVRAQEQDPAHRATLLALVELGGGEPTALVDAKKALLPTANESEKVTLLMEIGDIFLERLEDPPQAVGAYEEALRLQPTNHKVLHKCLDVYVEQKQWDLALQILDRLTQNETSGSVRARYRYTQALIYRDELNDGTQALASLQAALEDDVKFERALEAAEGLLQSSGNQAELVRLYRKMLKAIGPGEPSHDDGKNSERLRIWDALGRLFVEAMGDADSGIAAFEAALSFDASNLARYKALADLYQAGGAAYADKALAAQQAILRSEKSRIASYRAIKNLYAQSGQAVKATACSAALVLLRQGDAEDQEAVKALKSGLASSPIGAARYKINDEMWAALAHPAEDPSLRTLFSIVSPIVAPAQAQSYRALDLQKKDALAKNDPRPAARAIRYIATTLNLPMPEIFVREKQTEALIVAHVGEKQSSGPAALIGEPLLRSDRNERELVFEIARRLAVLKPERYLRVVLPHPAQVEQVIDAALIIAGRSQGASKDAERVAQGLKRVLNAAQLEQIGQLAARFAPQSTQANAVAWFQACDLTAIRTGYLMAGDLEISARLAAADPASGITLPPTQRLLELIWSSVTEELFTVRKALGLI